MQPTTDNKKKIIIINILSFLKYTNNEFNKFIAKFKIIFKLLNVNFSNI